MFPEQGQCLAWNQRWMGMGGMWLLPSSQTGLAALSRPGLAALSRLRDTVMVVMVTGDWSCPPPRPRL